MRWNRKGQVAILDALIFLAIASIASASLIGAVTPSERSLHLETQSFIDRAHNVFLRTTPSSVELSHLDLEMGENKTITVFEVIILSLIEAERTNDSCVLECVNDCLLGILDGLLRPSFEYSWKAEHNSTTFFIHNSGNDAQTNGSKYVSTVVSKMPMHGGDAILTLTAWRALQ